MRILEDKPADLSTPTGQMRARIFMPDAPGRFPGIVLWSEIFQITAPIARTAINLAGHGFVVAVPEVYHEFMPNPGVVLAYDQAGSDVGNRYKLEKELASYDGDAKAVVEALANHPKSTGHVGSWGMCLGGHLSLRAACTNPLVQACVCFYATDVHSRTLGKGKHDNTIDLLKDLKAELVMIWGRQDPHVPADGRRVVYDALAAANVTFSWLELNGQHAFIRDEGARYDPELAEAGMAIGLDVMRRALR